MSSPPSSSVHTGDFATSGLFDPLNSISPQELSDLVSRGDNYDALERGLNSPSNNTTTLRAFTFVSSTVSTLEEELERQQIEREILYNNLVADSHFRQTLRPILARHRLRATHRARRVRLQTPYNRSPVASTSALPPPSSPGSSSSHHSAGSGTHDDPIYIHDEDENICARCFGEGHMYEDCDAKIRTFIDCSACEYRDFCGKPKQPCDHYDITPLWAKRQRARLGVPAE